MNGGCVKLSWNTYETHLAATFKNLIDEKSFADVTLVSGDQIKLSAHKLVLSSCSPVLKQILLDNPHPQPLLYMRGINHQDMESLLKFMYLGEVSIFQDRIDDFLEVARELQVKGLLQDLDNESL